MKLQIERPHAEALIATFPDLASLGDQLRFGNRVELGFHQLNVDQLDFLSRRYHDGGEAARGHAAQLGTLVRALRADQERFDGEDLEKLMPPLADYLARDGIRGWLFRVSTGGKSLAYVVTRLDYTPPGQEETARILIELKANAKAKLLTENIMILTKDVVGRTISEILAGKGYLKETPELVAAYDATAEKYFDWRARYGAQFSGQGTGYFTEDPTATHRSTDWTRKDIVILSSGGGSARLVNDEGIIAERSLVLEAPGDILGRYQRRAAKSMRYDSKVENAVEESKSAIPKGMFTELPVHAYVLMFHLDLHHYLWVHADDVEPYRYQPELKKKLVLRPEQTDLIDILTAEMDVLMDDIVAGKSGGTTVLCAGPAGVGKTLTAEVYSEIIKRPLYRVHSGQLGLNVGAMETALKDVLTRAQRWGAVMLIDEADVYIKRRADDITMNAVVGVFLRVLEYFNGLLFLTTNRADDIDEAIVSRCIAIIKYSPPDRESRRRIWEVMAEQFELAVTPELPGALADLFPAATGRDIKGLAKLVAKYCQHKNASPTLEVFQRCSIFRGMDLGAPA